jgi:hypothetical protein
MDKDIEAAFVKTFLQKRLQNRIIWELASKKTSACSTSLFSFHG